MSITITGGITFGSVGGVSIIAPPSVATAGWYAGGCTPAPTPTYTSVTQRIIFATDTATATTRGTLSGTRYNIAGAGTLSSGWIAGGKPSNPGSSMSTVNRITYATDTATASIRGPLSAVQYFLAATSDNSTYGWFGGGYVVSVTSRVDRITYATDTATAVARGPLSASTYWLGATGTNTDGWFAGGATPSAASSTVSRITYATDTATATTKGPLSLARVQIGASTDNSIYGWFAGGQGGYSTVDRITYANDTATATARGPLSVGRQRLAASTDYTYGWFGGGLSATTVVDRITYATDTATATARGPLAVAVFGNSGTSGLQ